jgi:uncharacterized protein (DUF58 family)
MQPVTQQRRTTLCREGWYYLLVLGLIFGGAMAREVNLLLVLAGLLAGPLIFNWRTVVLTLRGLRVERKVPQGVCAGDLLVAQIQVRNGRRKVGCWAVVVEERFERVGSPRREQPFRPRVLFPYVPAGESRSGAYRGRLARRGRYRLGPLKVSTRFPFGLFSRTITVGNAETVTIFPRLGRLTRGWATRHRESFAGTHRREQRHGPEGDFYGVREWKPGDRRRWIHWRSSARSGRLVVRQFEQPRNRDVAVLVDLWQPRRPAQTDLDHVELAVSFAATVVAELCRKGDSDLLVGTTGQAAPCIRGPASVALLQDVMQALAVAEAHHEDRLPELLVGALAQLEPGSEIVLVSTRPVDLAGAAYQSAWGTDPARRAMARQIRRIDTSSTELAEYFQAE